MISYALEVAQDAENDPMCKSREAAFERLRGLGLDDFGEFLMLMPDQKFPRLSELMPSMASVQVQNDWTGENGYPLLRKSCNFARSLSYNYTRITGRAIGDAEVLDYGCGYGRIARLLYYFVSQDRLVGVDPWDRSIAECRSAGLGPNFVQSDYLPQCLPVDGRKFDLAYAFSVFTHLSKRATLQALKAIRLHMKPGAVLCITIRPTEYWDYDYSAAKPEDRETLKAAHLSEGFAFVPHGLPPVDGDLTYGDTSMTLAWLDENAAGWSRVGIDRSIEDSLQVYVFLRAA